MSQLDKDMKLADLETLWDVNEQRRLSRIEEKKAEEEEETDGDRDFEVEE